MNTGYEHHASRLTPGRGGPQLGINTKRSTQKDCHSDYQFLAWHHKLKSQRNKRETRGLQRRPERKLTRGLNLRPRAYTRKRKENNITDSIKRSSATVERTKTSRYIQLKVLGNKLGRWEPNNRQSTGKGGDGKTIAIN
ncbi:hypothetical protein HUJ05_004841 [Dendroctonus ponderosae]|nr:hypothetical protein HUJ05_004841 [Dendroctonus ponderosae]